MILTIMFIEVQRRKVNMGHADSGRLYKEGPEPDSQGWWDSDGRETHTLLGTLSPTSKYQDSFISFKPSDSKLCILLFFFSYFR